MASGTPDIKIIEPLCAVFRRRLRDEGLKYTAERARMLDAVMAMPGPFRVEELLGKLKGKGGGGGGGVRVSKATAYRTMRLLGECGIVQQIMLNSDEAHYQLAYGRSSTAMLVRTDEGAAASIEAPGLVELCEKVCRERGLRLNGQKLIIYAGKG